MTDRTWRVGALAAETGLTVRTLHYYDSIGLVRPSAHTTGGHRIYEPADVERLYAVLVLRRLGMPTAAIADELADGSGPPADLRSIAARQRAELDAQLAALGSLRHRLDELIDGEPDDAASPAAVRTLLGWRASGDAGPGQVDTPTLSIGIHDHDPKTWFEVFFAVDDLEASLAQVTALGGTVEGEVHVDGGFGRWSECTDDQGVRFGLRQPA